MGKILAIDPGLLLFGGLTSKDEVESRAEALLAIQRIRRFNKVIHLSISRNLLPLLMQHGLFPFKQEIHDALARAGLLEFYSTNDLVRYALGIAELELLEEVTHVDDIACSNYTGSIKPYKIPNNLAITFQNEFERIVGCQFLYQYSQQIGADAFIYSGDSYTEAAQIMVDLADSTLADISQLPFPLVVHGNVVGVHTEASIYKTIDPDAVWVEATSAEEIKLAILAKCLQSSGADVLPPIIVGPHFFDSLSGAKAAGAQQFASTVLEKCARAVHAIETLDKHPFLRGDEPLKRRDGAQALRVHVTKSGEAIRLHLWKLPNGIIEFVNVGVKLDLEFPT